MDVVGSILIPLALMASWMRGYKKFNKDAFWAGVFTGAMGGWMLKGMFDLIFILDSPRHDPITFEINWWAILVAIVAWTGFTFARKKGWMK